MPAIGSLKQIEEQETRVDPTRRHRDLAVRFRVLTPANDVGRILCNADGQEIIVGGRWDTHTGRWVSPQPPDLECLTWTIQEQQLRVFLECPVVVIFMALFAGRQAGKTFFAVMLVVLDAVRWPNRESAIVSLEFKASRDPERSLRRLIRPWLKTKAVRWLKTERAYVFCNGHTIFLRSRENIDSLRGPSLKTVLLDEASRYKFNDYNTAVGCGAASAFFRIILATTPKRDVQWIRDVDATWGQSTNKRHRLFRFKTDDNPRRNKELLEELKANTPADLYLQEFEGAIVPPEDAAYAALYRPAFHIRPLGQVPERVRFVLETQPKDVTRRWTLDNYGVAASYVMGWDFSKEAVVIGRLFEDARIVEIDGKKKRLKTLRLWMVGEEINFNVSTDHHARHVVEKWGTDAVVITDAIGRSAKSGGRGTERAAIDVLREHGFLSVEPVGRSNPPIEERRIAVCRALRSAIGWKDPAWQWSDNEGRPFLGGETKLFFAPAGIPLGDGRKTDGVPKLREALENQKMKDGKPEKDGVYEHPNDACGYLVCSVLPLDGGELPDGMRYVFRGEA